MALNENIKVLYDSKLFGIIKIKIYIVYFPNSSIIRSLRIKLF